MKLSKKLYISRVLREYTQRDIAKMIGTSAVLICQYEKGKAKPSKDIFLKLAKIYNFDKEYTNKILEELRERKDLTILTEDERKNRKKEQMKRADKKYHLKKGEKIHGISRN